MSQSRRSKSHKKPNNFVRSPSGGKQPYVTEKEIGYKRTDNPEKKIEYAESVTSCRGGMLPAAISRAGTMLLELSLNDEIPESKRVLLFGEAYDKLQTATKRDTSKGRTKTLEARNYLCHMNIYQALLLKQKPSPSQLDTSFELIMEFASELGNNKDYRNPRNYIHGMVGEVCVTALLRRYERHKLQDASWISVPSQYSEKHSISKAKVRNNWDITGFVSLDEDPYTCEYKIQVKNGRTNYSSQTSNQEARYAPDILIVNPSVDLAHPVDPLRLLKDCFDESNGRLGRQDQRYLDHRTNILLDILG